MIWRDERVINAIREAGYKIGWTDQVGLDPDGTETYNVSLVPLTTTED